MSEPMTKEEWLEFRRIEMEMMCSRIEAAVTRVLEPTNELAATPEEIAKQQAAKVAEHRIAMRRMFACAALQQVHFPSHGGNDSVCAERCWQIADAMLSKV